VAGIVAFLGGVSSGAASEGRVAAERLLAGDRPVLAGSEGWLFLPQELRALLAPRSWDRGAAAPPESDPLPPILDFRDQLRGAGVELIVVPVPPKLLLYPERLLPGDAVAQAAELGRELAALQAELARRGLNVLDLAPAFARAKDGAGDPLYCRTDTHWSPRGIALAAGEIAGRIGSPPWLAGVSRRALAAAPRELAIEGDLARLLPAAARPPRERLAAEEVAERGAGAAAPLPPWRESPVLLLGDSHVLVFHAGGDLHARGAGLPEQLALALGFPLDVVGVRGSGGTPARVNLMRRGDALAGKKVVVWVLAARELLAGTGWKKVPVVRR
jgi:alginate O-acetyltransferase complex protein AlgJ